MLYGDARSIYQGPMGLRQLLEVDFGFLSVDLGCFAALYRTVGCSIAQIDDRIRVGSFGQRV